MKNFGKKLISSTLLFSMFVYSATPVMAYTKEESVYSKLDNNGTAYQTIVSSHLKNLEKSKLLDDISDLMNIENVSGDQEFNEEQLNGDYTKEYNDDGSIIYIFKTNISSINCHLLSNFKHIPDKNIKITYKK